MSFFNPKNMVTSTGLLNDETVVWDSVRWAMWDYNGQQEETLCLKINMTVDGDGSQHEQYWATGKSGKNFTIVDDGEDIKPKREGAMLDTKSNVGVLMSSIAELEFDGKELDMDSYKKASDWDGFKAHMIRKPQAGRDSLKNKKEGNAGSEVLIVSEIVELPGEKKTKKTGSSSSGKSGSSSSSKSTKKDKDEDSGAQVLPILVKVLKGIKDKDLDDGKLTKKKIGVKMSMQLVEVDLDPSALKDDTFANDEWLTENLSELGWTYNAKSGTATKDE